MEMITRYLNNNRGQSIVEFALVLPVLVLILCGMMEFGRVFNEALVVTAAAREGARAAAIGANDSAIASTVRSFVAPSSDKVPVVVITRQNQASGTRITVQVTNQVEIITPLISNLLSGSFPVQGSAVMVQE